jgi:hypothetical protein
VIPAPTKPAPVYAGACKAEEIFFSIEKYNDQVGDGISFDQGEKFCVNIRNLEVFFS